MKIEKTPLEGCFVIAPTLHCDKRGLFFESYHKSHFENSLGLHSEFVQDNFSSSKKGVLRGLHYQEGDWAQAKLVSVLKGKALDVCLDIRQDSITFGKHFSIILDAKERKQVFVPRGFAHGFLALEEDTLLNYKCDNFYEPSSERGIRYDDPILNIDWGIAHEDIILSDKDKKLPNFKGILK